MKVDTKDESIIKNNTYFHPVRKSDTGLALDTNVRLASHDAVCAHQLVSFVWLCNVQSLILPEDRIPEDDSRTKCHTFSFLVPGDLDL